MISRGLVGGGLLLAGLAVFGTASAADPTATSTYESIGVYWKAPAPASGGETAKLEFRPSGASSWEDGLPLWFDKRNGEYRGSIVNLNPGKRYDIRVSLDNGSSQTFSASTWSDNYPIAKTVRLPSNSSDTLTITEGGSPSGYVLYTGPSGSDATIDVKRSKDFNVVIKADYVIVRGFTLKGAKMHAINIGETGTGGSTRRHIVIEENDITAWGSPTSSGSKWGRNWDSAVYSSPKTSLSNLTIQRNRMHHPNYASNSWEENNDGYHPRGPQPITLRAFKGGLVVRYNSIYSDDAHYFNDCMGGTTNFTTAGFPVQDSDIYGNVISYCRDNAVEAEGGNRNVRIWGNYFDKVYVPFGLAPVQGGPLYIWKNVTYSTNSGPKNKINGTFIKTRNYRDNSSSDWGGGRLYVFNNTVLKPKSGDGTTVYGFLNEVSEKDNLRNIRTLNNIMQVKSSGGYTIKEKYGKNVVFDYDLLAGPSQFSSPQERNAVRASPNFGSSWGLDGNSTGKFQLQAGSPGYDAGTEIPNFLTSWTGRGPDMGAHESMTGPMEFGVNAYR